MATIPCLKLLSGYEIPCVGLGTWQSNPGEVGTAVKAAIRNGYRHIDCAKSYGNEKEIGQAIKEEIEAGTVKREDLFITSKLWATYTSSATRIMEGFETSLTDLGLDYIDLYLIHWPMSLKEGEELFPLEPDGKTELADVDFIETWKTLQEVVDKGKCRSLGVANFTSKQIQRILDLGLKHPITCNQIEISPYFINEKLLQFCKSKDIVVVAYSPLGCNGRPWAKPDDPKMLEEPVLLEIGSKYNRSPAQISLRWGTQRGYAVIPKSVRPERLKENIDLFDIDLNDAEMKAVSGMNRNLRIVGFDLPNFADARHSPYYPFNEEF